MRTVDEDADTLGSQTRPAIGIRGAVVLLLAGSLGCLSVVARWLIQVLQ